jgi:hypothetical protein
LRVIIFFSPSAAIDSIGVGKGGVHSADRIEDGTLAAPERSRRDGGYIGDCGGVGGRVDIYGTYQYVRSWYRSI